MYIVTKRISDYLSNKLAVSYKYLEWLYFTHETSKNKSKITKTNERKHWELCLIESNCILLYFTGWVKSFFRSIWYLSNCTMFLFVLVLKEHWSWFNSNGQFVFNTVWPCSLFRKKKKKNSKFRKQVLLYIFANNWSFVGTLYKHISDTASLFEFPLIHVRFNG